MAFYNNKIDAIAMPCPVCEVARKKLDKLSSAETRKFELHLKHDHGMEK
jgi:hypothetical protein